MTTCSGEVCATGLNVKKGVGNNTFFYALLSITLGGLRQETLNELVVLR